MQGRRQRGVVGGGGGVIHLPLSADVCSLSATVDLVCECLVGCVGSEHSALLYKLKKTENDDQYNSRAGNSVTEHLSTCLPLIRADAHSIRVSRRIESITRQRRPFLKVLSDILSALDTGNIAMLTLLDLLAAFDSVDHNTFLRQLRKSYGLGGKVIDWFTSYLSDGKQQVRTTTSSSVPSAVLLGVPQGSVLRPSFLLYTADLLQLVKRHHLDRSID